MKSIKSYLFLAFLMAVLGIAILVPGYAATFAYEIMVADSTRQERLQTIGYNCELGEYLIVWSVDVGGGNTDLWGRRASHYPQFHWIGQAFPIAATGSPERAVAIAFNPFGDGEYLVVFEYAFSPNDVDVKGQRVAAQQGAGDDGSELIGAAIDIGVTVGNEEHPHVAYLPSTKQYLVVYELDHDIWARRVSHYHQGDGGGETSGGEFPIAANASRVEMQPVVSAGTQQSYFLVTYAYEFGGDDYDIRGQRVRGSSTPGNELIDASFDLAVSTDCEISPTIVYHQNAQAFLVAWQRTSVENDDIWGVWLDELVLIDAPATTAPFAIANDAVALEAAPSADIDATSSDVVVAFSYAPLPGTFSQLGLVWLEPDLHASSPIRTPLDVYPGRSFSFDDPVVRLCRGQSWLLVGYSARYGTSEDADRDAHLLSAARATTLLPMIWRS